MKTNKDISVTVEKTLPTWYIVIMLFFIALCLITIFHKSILVYCQQTYHDDFYYLIKFLEKNSIIQNVKDMNDMNNDDSDVDEKGNALIISDNDLIEPKVITNPIQKKHERKPVNQSDKISNLNNNKSIVHNMSSQDILSQLVKITNDILANNNLKDNKTSKIAIKASKKPVEKHVYKTSENDELSLITLNQKDRVLFAGDSLMQGVAPYVKKMLFKQYKIESINLSKQSTGLAYPKAFNWPKTINDSLVANPSIKLLVMFLGPNDPWDFAVKGYAKYAKFKSELWEEQYRLRIVSILEIAKQNHVHVLWLAPPCMRKPKLNDGMIYLTQLYKSEVEKAQQHFLETNELLGCDYDEFKSFIETEKQKVKVRVDDGIHFTPTGQKILAEAIMKQITIEELEDTQID